MYDKIDKLMLIIVAAAISITGAAITLIIRGLV